jgi:hypothetical protein
MPFVSMPQSSAIKSVSVTETKHSLPINRVSPIGLNFNLHTKPSTATSFLSKLGFNAGEIDARRSLLGCPYANGIRVNTQIRYSALFSVACIWDISWGVKAVNSKSASNNNLNIILILSNPVQSNKTPSPFMHKLDNNLPLEMLSVVDLIVIFGKF